jgi:toxin CptA
MLSAPAIGFEYRSPGLLRRAIIAVAALAVLAIGVSALPWWGKVVLVAAVLAATWQTAHRLRHNLVVAAGWGADDQWTLRLASRDDVAATLLSFRVLGAFVLLRLRVPGFGVQALLLGPDNSDADIRRRLRMRLATMQSDEALQRM